MGKGRDANPLGWSGLVLECAPIRIMGTDALDRSCFVFWDNGRRVGAWVDGGGVVEGHRGQGQGVGVSTCRWWTEALQSSQTQSPAWTPLPHSGRPWLLAC